MVLFLMVAHPQPGLAQSPSSVSDVYSSATARGVVGVSMAFARRSGSSALGMSLTETGAWHLSDHLRIDYAWQLPGAAFVHPTAVMFRIGNPMLGAHFYSVSDRIAFRVGTISAFPVARLNDTTSAVDDGTTSREHEVHALAQLGQGAWDAFLSLPSTWTLGVPARVELELEPPIRLAFEAGVFAALCMTQESCGGHRMLAQFGTSFDYTWRALRFGVRAHLAASLAETTSTAQLAAEPFVEYVAGSVAYRIGWQLNFNPPGGVSFSDRGVTAVTVGLRAAL